MNKGIFLVILWSVLSLSFAQTDSFIESCGQGEILEWLQENYPEEYFIYLQAQEILEYQSEAGNLALLGDVPKGTTYTIPVVFHIIHAGGLENISQEQIESEIITLNKTFNKLNEGVNSVYPDFLPIVGDAKIEFRLATIAPNGLCFNGVTRTFSSFSHSGESLYQLNDIIQYNDVYQAPWPHHQYLNIIVAKNLPPGKAGFANYPGTGLETTPLNMLLNSIFMRSDYVGTIGTSTIGITGTHEVGHWLNLRHVWGDTNEPGLPSNCYIDDGVSDTPNTIGGNSCANLTIATCNEYTDNIENFMEYSSCRKMFTEGQVARMRTALTSSISGRNNVWTNENLIKVGVLPGGISMCAQLEASDYFLCTGGTTLFSVDTETDIISYSWSFPGGIPAYSTNPSPTVLYTEAGQYDVELILTTANLEVPIIKHEFITVSTGNPTITLPFSEGFVDETFPPENWSISNGGNQAITWVRNSTQGTSPTAGNCAMIDNFTQVTTGNIDDLNLPVFSLENYESATLEFDVAYRVFHDNWQDELQVLVNTVCGNNILTTQYDTIYSKVGHELATEEESTAVYTEPQVWRRETIDLTPYIGQKSVNLIFRGVSGYGNYLYLDNISIFGVEGTGIATIPPTPAMTASSFSACINQEIQFVDLSSESPTSWQWQFPGGSPASSSEQFPVISYSEAGTYSITLEVGNSAGNNSETFNGIIQVSELPEAPIITQLGTVLAIGSTTNQIVTWTKDGVFLNYGGSTTIQGDGEYEVTVRNIQSGCVNSTSIHISSSSSLQEEKGNNKLVLFPNPTQGKIIVNYTLPIQEIKIIDNLGRIVLHANDLNETEVRLDLYNLESGTYFIQIEADNRLIKKLIIN